MKEIKDDYDALVSALTLAITAPDDVKAQKCVDIAERLAANFSQQQVESAKKKALSRVSA